MRLFSVLSLTLISGLGAAVFGYGMPESPFGTSGGAIGSLASLPPVAATDGRLSEVLSGHAHYKLLNIFSSTCGGCRFEHATLRAIATDGRVDLIGLNMGEPAADGARYLRASGLSYSATGSDPQGTMGKQLGVATLPESLLIDDRGNIILRHEGPLTAEVWANEVVPLISHAVASR